MTASAELPRYKCHKEVHALKITKVHFRPDGSAALTCESPEGYPMFEPIPVSADYVVRHEPKDTNWVGGYYVRYGDGYESWSPAKQFEEGYSLI